MARKKAQTDKAQMVSEVAKEIQKEFKAVQTTVAAEDLVPVSLWASTGSLSLDRAIAGIIPGGIPLGPRRGRVVHLFGDPSTGKSVILDHIMANCQMVGGIAIVAETEGSRDAHFAQAIGLKLGEVQLGRPNTLEEFFDWGEASIAKYRKRGFIGPILLGLDSLEVVQAGQTFEVKMSGKEGGSFKFGGGRAQAISAGMRKIAQICNHEPSSFVIINQIKDAVGVMFGSPKKASGGWAPKFMASVEIQLSLSKMGKVERNGEIAARWVHARIIKNKVGKPFREADFLVDFERGVRPWHGVIEELAKEQVVVVDQDKQGHVTGKEFIVRETGEVLPLTAFISWCLDNEILQRPPGSKSDLVSPPEPAQQEEES